MPLGHAVHRIGALSRQHRPLIVFLGTSSIILFFLALLGHHAATFPTSSTDPSLLGASTDRIVNSTGIEIALPPDHATAPKIAVLASANGPRNMAYEAALKTHQTHAMRFGYKYLVARETVMGGTWNKIPFLASLLGMELFKGADERLEWLLYVPRHCGARIHR